MTTRRWLALGFAAAFFAVLSVILVNEGQDNRKVEANPGIITFTNEYGVTMTIDPTPVIAEWGIEGQEYTTQPDGTVTITVK